MTPRPASTGNRPGRRVSALGLALPAILAIAGGVPAAANTPTLGGLMNHVNVGVAPNPDPTGADFLLVVTLDDPPPPTGLPMVPPGESFEAPFDVLDGRAYNAQYGWLRSGRWGLAPDETFYIERLTHTAGLDTYTGGLASDTGGTGQIGGGHELLPIFGTDGSADRWAWDLTMAHHWYATDTPGVHQATYRLYVEDDTGEPSATFEPTTVTLRWVYEAASVAGDFNASGQVEQGDLDLVLGHWGHAGETPAGWTGPAPVGLVDQSELDAVLQHWGATAAPAFTATVVPEPAGAAAVAIGLATMAGRPRRCRPGWDRHARHAPRPASWSGGFTLIELLVVISIIALLIGILLPTLGAARRHARTLGCLTTTRTLGQAMACYLQDHAGRFAPTNHAGFALDTPEWDVQFAPYLGYPGVRRAVVRGDWYLEDNPDALAYYNRLLRCPEHEAERTDVFSYAQNVYFSLDPARPQEADVLHGRKYWDSAWVPRPADTVIHGETAGGSNHLMAHFWALGLSAPGDGIAARHDDRFNAVFADGHAVTATVADTFDASVPRDRWHPAR